MSKRPGILAVAILCFVTVVVCFSFWSFEFDDGYIVYRIADNIAAGNGWVYNPGLKTNSSTSALWTLILAVSVLVLGSPGAAAHLLGAAALGFSALVLRSLLKPYVGETPALVASLILLTQPLLLISFGLETHLCLLLSLLSVWAYREEKPALTGGLGGLLILTRPDGLLLLGILFMDALFRRRRVAWQLVVFPAALWIPWAIFSDWYFGSFFPNTLAAKMAQGRSGLWSPAFPWPLYYLPLFFKSFAHWWRQVYSIPLLAVTAVLIGAGLRQRLLGHPALLWLMTWGALHLIAYSILKVPGYHWYFMPLVASFAVAVAVGFGQALACRREILRVAAWVCVSLVLLAQVRSAHSFCRELPEPRHRAYVKVSEWLLENTRPDESVALAEIGTVGYYSKRPVVDMAGIVDPEGPQFLRQRQFDWWLRKEPSVVVVHEPAWHLERGLLETPHARARYEKVASIEQEGYGLLHLWKRVSR